MISRYRISSKIRHDITWAEFLEVYIQHSIRMRILLYHIAGNFRLEKIFAFFAQARCGRKFFRRIILPSENFVTLNFLHAQVFTRGCQAVLVVPHDRQSAGIQTSSLLVNVVATNATLDFLCLHCFSTGSCTCEYGTRYSGVACSFESSTHYFLVSNSRCGRN